MFLYCIYIETDTFLPWIQKDQSTKYIPKIILARKENHVTLGTEEHASSSFS